MTTKSRITTFALVALALARLGRRWQAALVLVAIVAWPVAHIGNIAAVAVPVNLALVAAFGSLLRDQPGVSTAEAVRRPVRSRT